MAGVGFWPDALQAGKVVCGRMEAPRQKNHRFSAVVCLKERTRFGGSPSVQEVVADFLGTMSICRAGSAAGTYVVGNPSSRRTILVPWAIAAAL